MLILKQLRRKKNISQSDLADAIGVSLRTVQIYEKKNANIPIKNLNKIASYFEVGIDQLYAKEVNESAAIYGKSSPYSKKGITVSALDAGKYLLSVPLVMINEQAEYIEKCGRQEFLSTLSKVSFVIDQISVTHYLAFEISNNSMNNGLSNGIPQNAIVLGKQVPINEFSKNITDSKSFWVIVHKNGIMCKEITQYEAKERTLTCHSLNSSPEYLDFEISLDDVKELFEIVKKQVG